MNKLVSDFAVVESVKLSLTFYALFPLDTGKMNPITNIIILLKFNTTQLTLPPIIPYTVLVHLFLHEFFVSCMYVLFETTHSNKTLKWFHSNTLLD